MIKKLIQHKNKFLLMKLAILQIFVSFITNFYIVQNVGFNLELDVFYLAMSIFGFLSTSIGWSISAVLTPILIENDKKNIEGAMLINLLLISIPIFIVIFFTADYWYQFIFTNYLEKVNHDLILNVQKIFLVTFIFEIINILYLAILQQRNKYILINLLNLLGGIISLSIVYFFINEYGIYSAVVSQFSIRVFIFIILSIYLFRLITAKLSFKKEIFLLLWNRMKYIFIGSFYFRTGELLDRYIASFLSPGFLSLFAFIQKIYGSSNTVINSSIVAPTITKFSLLNKERKIKILISSYIKYLLFLFLVNSILFLIVIFFGKDIFMYFFNDRIDQEILYILNFTIITLFIFSYSQTIGKVQQNLLLSLKEEKRITQYDIFSFTINIFLKIVLTYEFNIYGLLTAVVLGEFIKYGLKGYLSYKILNNKGINE